MKEFTSFNDISELKRGDIIRSVISKETYVVTGNYGGRATAVKTVDVTNPMEWERMIDDPQQR